MCYQGPIICCGILLCTWYGIVTYHQKQWVRYGRHVIFRGVSGYCLVIKHHVMPITSFQKATIVKKNALPIWIRSNIHIKAQRWWIVNTQWLLMHLKCNRTWSRGNSMVHILKNTLILQKLKLFLTGEEEGEGEGERWHTLRFLKILYHKYDIVSWYRHVHYNC